MGLIGRPRKIAINWNYSGDNRRIEINVDVNFFLLAAFLDPRWKDLKMISQQKRDKASDMIRREMLALK